MQDGSNAALKRITLSITKEEPQKADTPNVTLFMCVNPHTRTQAFTDALSEVSSLQISLNKRVVAYKGFYVETENFEATGCVHLCILLECRPSKPHFTTANPFNFPSGTAPANPCSTRST